jgi:hypothetical protein
MDVPCGAGDPDGDAEEPTIGAAKVAPAPINATTIGIKTAWKETILARVSGDVRIGGNLTTLFVRQPTLFVRQPTLFVRQPTATLYYPSRYL